MTGAGYITKTKPHIHTIPQRDHTMTTVLTRATKTKAKQSRDANMIDASEVHTPQRAEGTNGAAPTTVGVTVTPPAAKHNTATAGRDGDEESNDGGAQTPAIEVETPNITDAGKLFSLVAAKGNKDADTETTKNGHTNDEARPETSDAEPDTTDREEKAGSKRTHKTVEEENPIDASKRKDRLIAINHSKMGRGSGRGTKAFTSETQG